MRKTLGFVSTLALLAGLAGSAATVPQVRSRGSLPEMLMPNAVAASVEHSQAINGASANYAAIAPTFLGATGGPISFIRFFNGASGTSTFSVTIVGAQSGQTYGTPFTLGVPHLASSQYALSDLVKLAGVTPGSFTNGDTEYAIYLQDPDSEAGYQHVVYEPNTGLFENVSSCASLLNEQMVTLHNELILANVHGTKGPNHDGVNYPSRIIIHNYYNVPITYTVSVFNAGSRTSTGALSPNSGKLTCQIRGNTVPANSSLTLPVSTIEANSNCIPDSDEDYYNITVADQSGGLPNAVLTHLVHVSLYNGDTPITDVCAVNKITPAATGTSGGGGGTPIISPYL